MIAFLKHIVLVVVIFILSAVGLDKIYSYLLIIPGSDSPLKEAFSYSNQEWDLVFFGSSRVVNNIDCDLITELTGKSCLNMGAMGSTSKLDAFLFETLLSNQNTIKEAFFQVDYKYNDLSIGSQFKADLIPYSGRKLVDQHLEEERGNIWLWNTPFYRYAIHDKVIGIRKVLIPVLGFFGRDSKNGYRPLNGESVLINVSLPKSYKKNSNSDLYIIAKGDNSVNLNYFTAPFCKDIENREEIEVLASFYDNYINYTKIYDDKQEYFNDCLHLNSAGASSFSKLLAEEIKSN